MKQKILLFFLFTFPLLDVSGQIREQPSSLKFAIPYALPKSHDAIYSNPYLPAPYNQRPG